MIPIGDVNPRRHFPLVTVIFIAINTLVFIYQLTLSEADLQRFFLSAAIIPARVTQSPDLGALWSIITSMFLHGGTMHIIGNMLYLWIFGDNIEELFGALLYIFFYLLSGIVAAAAQVLVYPTSTTPTLGASGAVAGVLGAYAVLFPQARVRTLLLAFYFIRFVELPALLVLGFWFVIQLFSGATAITTMSTGGVAWFAHIGGFSLGLLAGFFYRIVHKGVPRRRPT
ncbi:MAG: rhomboid family intramembrane serine protease [Chloroflexi bacterium]|nr:rhomboid family intramembrane serine protease [Chloroflexota bacterium]